MTIAILTLIIIGYALMATRAWNHINKAAIAIFIGVAAWLLYMIGGAQYVRSEHSGEFTSYILSTPDSIATVKHFISTHVFVKYITEACEIILFILATIGIVEVLNGNCCFDFLCKWIRSRNSRKVMWSLVAATFIISANLDNLSTTVLMLVIMHKIVSDPKLRMVYGATIVIAANCGGALTVIGDINGLALWTKGYVTPTVYSAIMAIPVILMTVITTWLISRRLPYRITIPSLYDTPTSNDGSLLSLWQRITMLIIGIGGLWFIPTFHNLTSLPPYVGAICVLSLLWVANEIFNLPFIRSERMVLRHSPIAVQYENIQTILFYIGVTLISGVCIEIGVTEKITLDITRNIDNIYVLGSLWGIISIILDSVIVIVNNTAMYTVQSWEIISRADLGLNGIYWPVLNYFCLFGSTLLTIGTMGGIMLMRMENVSFLWYLRRITPKVIIGGVAGTIAIVIITTMISSWYF